MKYQGKFWSEDATTKDKVVFFIWLGYGTVLVVNAIREMRESAHVERELRRLWSLPSTDDSDDLDDYEKCAVCNNHDLSEMGCPNDREECIDCCLCHRHEALDDETEFAKAYNRYTGNWPDRQRTMDHYKVNSYDMTWAEFMQLYKDANFAETPLFTITEFPDFRDAGIVPSES